MIESKLTNEDIIKRRPELEELYPDNSNSWEDQIADASAEIIADVKDMGWNIRKLCKRLALDTAKTFTATGTGTVSDEDILQRQRLTIKASSVTGTGTATFTLKGSDDETTFNTIDTVDITDTTEQTLVFNDIYKYYRLDLTTLSGITSITYTAYLIETTFERLHLYKSLELIYALLGKLKDDTYYTQAKEFEDKYNNRLNSVQFAYDNDDDGGISEEEKETNNQRVKFRV